MIITLAQNIRRLLRQQESRNTIIVLLAVISLLCSVLLVVALKTGAIAATFPKSPFLQKRFLPVDDAIVDDVEEEIPMPKKKCSAKNNNREKVGNAAWHLLHSIAQNLNLTRDAAHPSEVKQFVQLFAKLYACKSCSKDFQHFLATSEELPQATQNFEHAFPQWLCMMHNKVNAKLDKAKFDCDPQKLNDMYSLDKT